MDKDISTFNLIKDKWNECDKKDFIKYIRSLGKDEASAKFEKRILNTNYDCIAVPSKDVDRIVKLIYKGNFLSFIDLWIRDNHTCLVITGKLIAKIKDFELFKDKLLKYISFVDSWAGCDCLKFTIAKNDEEKFFNLANELIKSHYPFNKRLGLIMLFKLINDTYIDKILDICNSLHQETHYYVNMANAWLVAECLVKQRDKTLNLIKSKTLNKFVQNKAISKSRDSYRVSAEDKEILISYRIK